MTGGAKATPTVSLGVAPMPDTREQIIEQMARAEWGIVWPNSDPALASREFIRTTAAALPIAVRAVTARVRELHHMVEVEFGDLLLPDLRALIRDTHALLDQIDAEWG